MTWEHSLSSEEFIDEWIGREDLHRNGSGGMDRVEEEGRRSVEWIGWREEEERVERMGGSKGLIVFSIQTGRGTEVVVPK